MAKKRKGKLELNWVDKGDIILTKFDENGKTYPASYFHGQVVDEELMPRELELVKTVGAPDSENMLIQGENLIALRSLEREFAGKIKLIYIDPPFNTGQDFEDYEDGLEHSIWLTLMENRLRLAKRILANNGVVFVHIDSTEVGKLRMLLDEIFGYENIIAMITWQRASQRTVLGQGSTPIINIAEYILIYSKNEFENSVKKIRKAFLVEATNEKGDISDSFRKLSSQYNQLFLSEGQKIFIKELITGRGEKIKLFEHKNWEISPLSKKGFSNKPDELYKLYIENFNYLARFDHQQTESTVEQTVLSNIKPEKLFSTERLMSQGKRKGQIVSSFYLKNNVVYYLKNYALVEKDQIYRLVDMNNLWLDTDISAAGIANEGGVKLKRGKKPEALIKRIIELSASDKDDYILDFFAGSGTTGAVAHKMGLKWIMIELREDMVKEKTLKRMKNVVAGDPTGISKEVGWKGGGGFKFYKLGEPLIIKHKDYPSIKIINPKYYNGPLVKVICKLEGFQYKKDDKVFYGVNKLGNKFAHITEQYISQGYIDFLKSRLVDNEELIVYCFNYDDKIDLPLNIIIKKLPDDLGKPYQLRLGV